jgi:type I site-specific restriction endonuclease
MTPSGYNEADTRAKLIDPALHARQWIELVKEEHRLSHGEIHREQSAVRIDILDGKPIKRGRGRVDYLLRAYIADHEQPLTLAFIEAKKEKLPPTQGLEQVKEYARRHAVKFVYSTNGHQFVEFDITTGKTTDPLPLSDFPTPAELRRRWFDATGLAPDARRRQAPAHALRVAGEGQRRYFQDAAIRAVFEKRRPVRREHAPPAAPRPALAGHRHRQDLHRLQPAATPHRRCGPTQARAISGAIGTNSANRALNPHAQCLRFRRQNRAL